MRILIVSYLSRLPKPGPWQHFSFLARHFSNAQAKGDWPYDVGDDPSFFSARSLSGPVTWGVCRQDVRGQLRPRDLVIFFSTSHQVALRRSTYRLAAALTVESRLTQDQIFRGTGNTRLSDYLNLLVRPKDGGWEHFEPALPLNEWHDDWMWRVCEHKWLRKSQFVIAGKTHKPGAPLTVAGGQALFADNYIVFSLDPSLSVVLPTPPIVAVWAKGQHFERWLETPLAQRIHALSLGTSYRRNLRTRNKQQPHRHIWTVSDMSPEELVESLRKAVGFFGGEP